MLGAPLYTEPQKRPPKRPVFSAPFSLLITCINECEHTEDENKGTVTYIHLTHSAALDVRFGYPLQNLIRRPMQTGFQFTPPKNTDNPPGQNLE